MVLFLLLTSILSGNVYAEEVSLAEFDGLKNEILGPMDCPVPKSYFTKDLTPNINSGNSYYATFKVDIADMYSTILTLNDMQQNGKTYPIVLSIRYSDEQFHNYILQLGNSTDILIDLSYEADYASAHSKSGSCDINILCDILFSGEINKNGVYETLQVIEPIDSSGDTALEVKSSETYCCLDMTEAQRVLLTHQSGATYIAWIKVSKGNCLSGYYISCYGLLDCFYPTQNDLFHKGYEQYYCTRLSAQNGVCVTQQHLYMTRYLNYPSITHKWSGIRELIAYGQQASIEDMGGPGVGTTWTVNLSFVFLPVRIAGIR